MNKSERQLLNAELLRSFESIANSGNLTIAAGQLHRTQSAISVQLGKLEASLGVALFHRTSKGMTLTGAGSKLLPKARLILQEIKQISSLFDQALVGTICLGIPDDFNDHFLERILRDFSIAHPGVDVVAVAGCTSTYPDAVRNREIDVAVCSGPYVEQSRLICTEKIVWAAKRGAATRNEEIVPLAVLDRNCWWRDMPNDALNAAGRDYKVAFRSSSFASIQAAIRAGFAIGALPMSCLEDDMEILSKANGFPALPNSQLSILVGAHTPNDLATAMSEAILDACQNQTPSNPT